MMEKPFQGDRGAALPWGLQNPHKHQGSRLGFPRGGKIDPRVFPKILNSPPFNGESDALQLQPPCPIPGATPLMFNKPNPSNTQKIPFHFSRHPKKREDIQKSTRSLAPGSSLGTGIHPCSTCAPPEQPKAVKIQSVPAHRATPSPSLPTSHQAWTVRAAEFPSCPWWDPRWTELWAPAACPSWLMAH